MTDEELIQEKLAQKLAEFWNFCDFPNGKGAESQSLEELARVAVSYLGGKL